MSFEARFSPDFDSFLALISHDVPSWLRQLDQLRFQSERGIDRDAVPAFRPECGDHNPDPLVPAERTTKPGLDIARLAPWDERPAMAARDAAPYVDGDAGVDYPVIVHEGV